jgi:hypothetical protein
MAGTSPKTQMEVKSTELQRPLQYKGPVFHSAPPNRPHLCNLSGCHFRVEYTQESRFEWRITSVIADMVWCRENYRQRYRGKKEEVCTTAERTKVRYFIQPLPIDLICAIYRAVTSGWSIRGLLQYGIYHKQMEEFMQKMKSQESRFEWRITSVIADMVWCRETFLSSASSSSSEDSSISQSVSSASSSVIPGDSFP